MGAAAGQNLVRATDQWDSHAGGQTADDPIVWSNMDYLLAAARKRGVVVVIDLSAFRWLQMSQGADPSQPDLWIPFIDQVAARYRDNTAIAFYSIVGEPKPPTTASESQALLGFYRTTSEALRAPHPNPPLTAGASHHHVGHPEVGA